MQCKTYSSTDAAEAILLSSTKEHGVQYAAHGIGNFLPGTTIDIPYSVDPESPYDRGATAAVQYLGWRALIAAGGKHQNSRYSP